MDERANGLSLVTLNVGRSKADDGIDYAVGLSGMAQIGDYIEQCQPLAVAHVRNDNQLALINQELVNLIQLATDASRLEPLVKEIYQA